VESRHVNYDEFVKGHEFISLNGILCNLVGNAVLEGISLSSIEMII